MIVAEITAAIMAIFVILLIIAFFLPLHFGDTEKRPRLYERALTEAPKIRTAPSMVRQGGVKGVLMFREALGEAR